MLAVIVLCGLSDPHGRIAGLEQRHLVAAPAIAVGAIDHDHVEIVQIAIGQPVEIARQIARGAVDLAAIVAAAIGLLRRLDGLGTLRENPHLGVVHHPALAAAVADDVVVEIGLDLPALGPGVIGQDLAAQQALFLARQHGINEGGREPVLGQHARGLDHRGNARGIVIGTGGVTGEVHHVADAAVDMAGDQDHPVGVAGALLDRQDIDHLRRIGHAPAGDDVRRRLDGQAAAAVLADGLEALLGPAARGPDAPGFGLGLRQGVTGSEPDQRADRAFQRLGIHFGRQGPQQGLIRRWRCCLSGLGGRSQQQA